MWDVDRQCIGRAFQKLGSVVDSNISSEGHAGIMLTLIQPFTLYRCLVLNSETCPRAWCLHWTLG